MKLSAFLSIVSFCLTSFTIYGKGLEALEADREMRGLVKVKLHGEPIRLVDELDNNYSASKSIAFSPDGKHLAVGFTPGPVIIYDLTAEKAKRFDRELELMKRQRKIS